MNWRNGEYFLTDDKTRLDLDVICDLLHGTYWASERSREAIQTSVENSVCFGLFHHDKQVGFARAVTDFATFTWICDVIVAPEHRAKGLGKWMVESVLAHPQLQTTQHVLRTKDAHTLYERFGFERTEYLRRAMDDRLKGRSNVE